MRENVNGVTVCKVHCYLSCLKARKGNCQGSDIRVSSLSLKRVGGNDC